MTEVYRQTREMLYRDLIDPGFSKRDTLDSDSDSEYDSDGSNIDFLSEYTDIDVNGFLGRAIAIWTYNRHDNLTLFTPHPDDTLFQLVKYAEQRLKFNRDIEKIMVMDPGDKIPREMRDIYTLKPGSVIMVMPKKNLNVTVEIDQINAKFPISADPMCAVHEVKMYIRRVKGIPLEQQDILYKDKILENARRLYEYKVRNGTSLHVLIQVHFDVLVNVETFWGKTYRLYVDRCSTSSDILYRVFSRAFSKHGKDNVTMHELYVPIHALVVQHKRKSLNWEYCLGFYGVRNGDTLTVNTVGKLNDMNIQSVIVVTELGENFEVYVSQFDRWSVVAFMLHGYTDVPIDLIRLYKNDLQLNFTANIGYVAKDTVIMMNVTMSNVDRDTMFGVPLKINVGNGIVENIKAVATKKIKDIKQRLEEIGVPNAKLYEIATDQFRLPDSAKIQDTISDLNKSLYLKVEKFPMFVHAPDGMIYKTMVDVNNSMKGLKQKIEMKSGHAMSNCRLLMAGQEISLPDNNILYDSGFSTRNSIFVLTTSVFETFFVVNGNNLIKLRVPYRPSQDNIKRSIWGTRDIPEGSITCLQTFLFWFFSPRRNKKFLLSKRRKHRKRIPPLNVPLHLFSDRREKGHDVSRDTIKFTEPDVLDFKPVTYPDDSAEDVKTHRTWPVSLHRSFRPKPNVEDWINATHNDSTTKKRHTRTPTRKKSMRSEKRNYDLQTEPKHYVEARHMQPRWLGKLQRKETKFGLSDAENSGWEYRQKPKKDFYAQPLKKKEYGTGNHHQGDASLSRYLRKKRRHFEHQELAYISNDDSDSDEDPMERPSIVLR